MDQVPSSVSSQVLTTDPTLQPVPQPGPGRLAAAPATPSSGPHASPLMVSIRVNGDSFKLPRPLVAPQGDADQNPTSATASKPLYSRGPRTDSLPGLAFEAGDQSRAHRLQPLANKHRKADVITPMLKPGTNANATDMRGSTALQNACRRGRIEEVKMLMAHSDVNSSPATTGLTPTPLYIAAEEGHLELLNYLLEAGIDPNIQDVRNKRTALMAAAANGNAEIMSRLLECEDLKIDLVGQNPKPDLSIGAECTALQLAMVNGKRSAVISLLKAGAKFVLPTGFGYRRSLVQWAIQHRDCDMLRLVLERCAAGSGQVDVRCDAALKHAVAEKCADIVECLLEAGHAGLAPHELLNFINRESNNQSHAVLIEKVFAEQAHRASAIAAGEAAKITHGDNMVVIRLEKYTPAIAIADLQLLHRHATNLWPDGMHAFPGPVQFISQLTSSLNPLGQTDNVSRERLLSKLHEHQVLTAVALPVLDCLTGRRQGLALFAGPGAYANARQMAIYYAAALSTMRPEEQSEAATRVYAAAGVSATGVERLGLAAQRQFAELQELLYNANALLGAEMLEQIMPACLELTDSEYQVDVDGLAEKLLVAGMMRTFANVVAECWRIAVNAQKDVPLTIPSGATFIQVVHILKEAMSTVTKRHFAVTLGAKLREHSLLARFNQISSAAEPNDPLQILYMTQAEQLEQFCAYLPNS